MRTVTAILDTDQTKLCYVDSAGAFSPLGFLCYRGEWLDLRLTIKTANQAAVLSNAHTYQIGAKSENYLLPRTDWYTGGLSFADALAQAHSAIPAFSAVTKLWTTATDYGLYDILYHGSSGYRCKEAHTSDASTQPGVGAAWETVWEATTYHNPSEGKLQFSINCNTNWFAFYLVQGTRTSISTGGITRGYGKTLPSEVIELDGSEVRILAQGSVGLLPDILTGQEAATLYSPGVAHNSGATTDPTVDDDAADGFQVGSSWSNITAGRIWLCTDPTAGAAVWRLVQLAIPAETIATNQTLTAPSGLQKLVANTAGGNLLWELPPVAGAHAAAELQLIKGAAANTLTIRPDGAETINGVAGDATLTIIGEYLWLIPVTGGWLHLNPTYIRQ